MTLPLKGEISLEMIRKEIRKEDKEIYLKDYECKLLADKEKTDELFLDDFYGKQYWYTINISRDDTGELIKSEEVVKKSMIDFSPYKNYDLKNKVVYELIDNETGGKVDFTTLIINRDYNIKALTKNKNFIVTFIAETTHEKLLEVEVTPNSNYRLSITDTSKERSDFLPIIQKSDKFYYGPVGFKIDDGQYSPKGDKKWTFDRTITADTTVEVEMMKFDYYFSSSYSFKSNITNILSKNNNDLSNISIGFSDIVTETNSIFDGNLSILKTPKYFYGRRVKSSYSTFMGCDNLNTISDHLFDNYFRVEDLSSIFAMSNNSSISELSNKMFLNNVNLLTLRSSFKGLNLLTTIPSSFLKNNSKLKDISFIFSNCKNLKTVAEDFLSYSREITGFESSFYNDYNITGISGNFFNNIPDRPENNFINTFSGCTGINTKMPELWLTHSSSTKHTNFAKNCKRTTNYEVIPTDWGGPKFYTIIFEVGNNAPPFGSYKIMEGVSITLPSTIPVNAGYVFKGWYEDPDFQEEASYLLPVFQNLTFYAKIEKDDSSVVFERDLIFGIGIGPNLNSGKVVFKSDSERILNFNGSNLKFNIIDLQSDETSLSFRLVLDGNVVSKFTSYRDALVEIKGITDTSRNAEGVFTLEPFYTTGTEGGTHLWDINASIGSGDFSEWFELFASPNGTGKMIEYKFKLRITFNKFTKRHYFGYP